MSWTRILLRIVLVLLLIGAVGIGGVIFFRTNPLYLRSQAERSFEAEDYESAQVYLRRLIKKDPTDADAHEFLSRAILRGAEARDLPASYAAQPAARAHLARASELKPEDLELQRRLLRAYLDIRDIPKAAEVAELVYAADSKDGDAHLALTWRAVTAKDAKRAEELFAQSSNVVSRHVFHDFGLRLTLYSEVEGAKDSQKYRTALLEALKTAERLSEDDMRLLTYSDREMMLKVLLNAQRQLTTPWDKTFAANVTISACEKLRSAELLDKKTIAAAAATSQRLLAIDAPSTGLSEKHLAARRGLTLRGGVMAADALNDDAQETSGASIAAYWGKALGLFENGRWQEALSTLDQGIAAVDALGEDSAEQKNALHLLAARILADNHQFGEAAKHLEQLKGTREYDGWMYLYRGKMELGRGQFEAALRDLQIADEHLGDNSLHAKVGLALAHGRLQQWEESIPYLEACLAPDDQLQPDDVAWRNQQPDFHGRIHLDLLRTRLKIGHWANAQQNLAALKGTELAPKAWALAIDYLWSDGQQEKSWQYLRLVRQRYPDDTDFLFREVEMLEAIGKPARAKFVFQDFVGAKPDDPVRKMAMARWQLAQNKSEQALKTLDGVRENVEQLSAKERNTLIILAAYAHIQLRKLEIAQRMVDSLIANPDTAPVGHMLDSMIAYANADFPLVDAKLAKARESNQRNVGKDRTVVRLLHPNGETMSAIAQNTYFW